VSQLRRPRDLLENTLPLTAGEEIKPSTALEAGECFAPFIPQASVSPVPTPAPKPRPTGLARVFDKICRDKGWDIPAPTDPTPGMGTSTSAEAGSTDDTDPPVTEPSEILPASEGAPPLPAPRRATAFEIFMWITRSLMAQTHLHEDDAEVVAFWVVSTWFQDVTTLFTCLIITGSAHYAGIQNSIHIHISSTNAAAPAREERRVQTPQREHHHPASRQRTTCPSIRLRAFSGTPSPDRQRRHSLPNTAVVSGSGCSSQKNFSSNSLQSDHFGYLPSMTVHLNRSDVQTG
jgi:hypothetical protein